MNLPLLAEQLNYLTRDILGLLIEYPRELRVDAQVHPGRIDVRILPNINDQGRVVGRDGAHVKALKHLLARAGLRHGVQVVLFLEEDENGKRVVEPLRPPSGLVASPTVPVRVLHGILGALTETTATIKVERTPGPSPVLWQVDVYPASHADYVALVEENVDSLADFEAITTLYKAVAKRNGVEIKLVCWK